MATDKISFKIYIPKNPLKKKKKKNQPKYLDLSFKIYIPRNSLSLFLSPLNLQLHSLWNSFSLQFRVRERESKLETLTLISNGARGPPDPDLLLPRPRLRRRLPSRGGPAPHPGPQGQVRRPLRRRPARPLRPISR